MAIACMAAPSVMRVVAVHRDLVPSMGIARAAEHTDAVEVHGGVAGAVDGEDAAFAARAAQLHLNDLVHRLRQRQVAVENQRTHIVGNHLADVVLALAGAGYRTGLVAGVRAGADQRGVPHPTVVLVGEAPGGGGCREVAGAVERHRTNRAHAVVRARVDGLRGRGTGRARTLGAARLLELLLARLGAEISARHEHYTLLQREVLGALGHEQHVRTLLHHETCQLDRVLHVPYGSYRTGARSGA